MYPVLPDFLIFLACKEVLAGYFLYLIINEPLDFVLFGRKIYTNDFAWEPFIGRLKFIPFRIRLDFTTI